MHLGECLVVTALLLAPLATAASLPPEAHSALTATTRTRRLPRGPGADDEADEADEARDEITDLPSLKDLKLMAAKGKPRPKSSKPQLESGEDFYNSLMETARYKIAGNFPNIPGPEDADSEVVDAKGIFYLREFAKEAQEVLKNGVNWKKEIMEKYFDRHDWRKVRDIIEKLAGPDGRGAPEMTQIQLGDFTNGDTQLHPGDEKKDKPRLEVQGKLLKQGRLHLKEITDKKCQFFQEYGLGDEDRTFASAFIGAYVQWQHLVKTEIKATPVGEQGYWEAQRRPRADAVKSADSYARFLDELFISIQCRTDTGFPTTESVEEARWKKEEEEARLEAERRRKKLEAIEERLYKKELELVRMMGERQAREDAILLKQENDRLRAERNYFMNRDAAYLNNGKQTRFPDDPASFPSVNDRLRAQRNFYRNLDAVRAHGHSLRPLRPVNSLAHLREPRPPQPRPPNHWR